MKYFKDIKALKKRLKKSLCWDDYFSLKGRIFNIYEYGGGSMMKMNYDYVYFLNKLSGDMIHIKYNCPSSKYVNGKKVVTGEYEFYGLEYIPNAYQWR